MADLVLGFGEGVPDVADVCTPGKWKTIHELVEKLPVVNRTDNKGWFYFILADKKLASRAAGSAATYCLEKLDCHKRGWRLQTMLTGKPDGTWVAWVRKIRL